MKTILRNTHHYWKFFAVAAAVLFAYEKGHYDGDIWGAESLWSTVEQIADKHPDETLKEFKNRGPLKRR